MRLRRIIVLLVLVSLALPEIPLIHTFQAHATGSVANPLYFSHVVWLVMENHKLAQINTGTAATNGSLAYQLNIMNASAAAYNSGYESTSGSLPNYLAMLSGNTQTSCDSGPATCGTFGVSNLVDGLETAGATWKAYMEGWSNSSNTNSCSGAMRGDGGTNYIAHHNPFIYFNDIVTSGTRCQDIVAAGSYAGITGCGGTVTSSVAGNLINDLGNRSTAPNFMYLVPNNYDNTHDCSNYAAVGNNYLKTLIPLILNSDTFVGTPSAIIISYDEGTDAATTEPIYTVWIGPQAQAQLKNTDVDNHYSILKTIEDNWGISYRTSNDQNANSMSSFLFSYPVNTMRFDAIRYMPSAVCGNAATINMPASTMANVTILGVFASHVTLPASLAVLSSINKPTDTFGVSLADDTNGPRDTRFNTNSGTVQYGIETFYGFSAAKIPAGTITIFMGDNSPCTLTVYYIGNTGSARCSVAGQPNCILKGNDTTAMPTIPNYTNGITNSSLEVSYVAATDGSPFYAAEPGYHCIGCEGSYNTTVYSGLEYNVTSATLPKSTVSYNDYNGAGLGLSHNWIMLTDGIYLNPPPAASSGGNNPQPFQCVTSCGGSTGTTGSGQPIIIPIVVTQLATTFWGTFFSNVAGVIILGWVLFIIGVVSYSAVVIRRKRRQRGTFTMEQKPKARKKPFKV